MRPTLLSSILLSLLTVGALGGCRRDQQAGLQEVKKSYIGPEITTVTPSDPETSRRACERLMRDVLAEPAVPGAPGFEAERAELLARAKAEPVYFTQTPQYGSEPPTLTVKGYRAMLAEGNPYGTVQRIIDESAGFPKQARDALLKDGYLYAERPELAYALVSLVQPHQLFGTTASGFNAASRSSTRSAGTAATTTPTARSRVSAPGSCCSIARAAATRRQNRCIVTFAASAIVCTSTACRSDT